jgi:hypothetical protein
MSMLRIVSVSTLLGLLSAACDDDKSVKQIDDEATACQCPLTIEVDNLAICGAESTASEPPRVYSSAQTGGQPSCETDQKFPHSVPTAPWTKLRIGSPCAGDGKLCFSLRQGDSEDPKASDCVLATHCVDFAYQAEDGMLELPALPGWTVTDEACAVRYESFGGYLEFHAEAEGLGCATGLAGAVTVATCPMVCAKHPELPECADCSAEPLDDEL